MDSFYFLLSALYVFNVYFWADSPLLVQIRAFNPFSLLHIPLYGFLAVLLLLSSNAHLHRRPAARYILVGLVALSIAVVDEVRQTFLPFREGSVTDLLLDLTGIAFAMLVFSQLSVSGGLRRFGKFRKVPFPRLSS